MSEVITRFKLETTQYDSKLRDASRSLADLARHLSMAGKDFDAFAQKHVASAAALGQVASGANNTKDKLKDLVAAYNETAKAYNVLTVDQKSSDFGKAMAESLVTLRDRIKETKTELYSVGDGAKSTGGIMDQLASKFTLNIDAMKLFNIGLQAAQGALNVVKDAFFNNEEQLDEWGRVVESSQSLYEGFLNALNTGDISGYIDNIGNIVKAARDAYDALDALNTFNAFNQINVEKTRTGMTEAIVDYREGNSTKEAVKASGEAYKKELQERQRLERNAYLKAVAEMAAKRGVSAKDLTDALSGTYGHYQDLKEVHPTGERIKFYGNSMFGGGGYYTEKFAQNDRERLGEALRHLNDTELQSLQALGAQAERTGNEIAGVDRQLVRVLNGRQGTGSGGGKGGGGGRTVPKPEEIIPAGSVADLTKQMSELRKEQNLVTNTQDWKTYEERIKEITNYIKGVKGELSAIGVGGLANASGVSITGGASESVDSQQKGLKDKSLNMETVNEKIAAITKGGKDAEASWREAAQAIGSVGSALAGIEDPAVKIAGTIGIAIANIAAGFAEASAKEGKGGIWYWIAATASGLATMISTISTIHSATGYARGGIVDGTTGGFVGGSSFSGDNIGNVRLDSGELVLNRSMQNNLANALQDSRNDYAESRPYVTGEMIYLALNNYMRRSGHGEILKVR